MPRTAIAVQQVVANSGAQITTAAADSANNMLFPNDGKTDLLVENGSGGSINVTVHSVPCSHGRTGDLVLAVAAGTRALLGPFDPALWNQVADTQNVYVDFSASASVTVAARKT